MELLFACAFLGGVALLLTSLWSLGARPHPSLILITMAGAAAFTWFSVEEWLGYFACNRLLAARQRYDLDASGAGERTIRVNALPGADGIQVQAALKDGGDLRGVSLAECRWRAREPAGAVEMVDGCLVIHRGSGFGKGDRTWVDVTYWVDESSAPLIRKIYLEAVPTGAQVKDSYVNRDICLLGARIGTGGAFICLAGLVSQIVRRARRRKSPIASRQSGFGTG